MRVKGDIGVVQIRVILIGPRLFHALAAALLFLSHLATVPGTAAAGREEGNAELKGCTAGLVIWMPSAKQVGWAAEIEGDKKAAESEGDRAFTLYAASVQRAWKTKRESIV